mgnify:CR=1 FL=1
MNLDIISSNKSFGGWHKQYRHRSTVLDCEMRFAIYLPPQALTGQKVPVLYWLSGLTCTDENFMQKAGAQRIAAELGIALVNWVATLWVAPRPLPRMDFSKGIPATARTLVAVPSMLGSTEGVDALVEALEVRFLANRDRHERNIDIGESGDRQRVEALPPQNHQDEKGQQQDEDAKIVGAVWHGQAAALSGLPVASNLGRPFSGASRCGTIRADTARDGRHSTRLATRTN